MDAMRKLHNGCKKRLINKFVQRGSVVLDCGSGRGGDLWKWRDISAKLTMIDPDLDSIQEAMGRASAMKYRVNFLPSGDIRHVTGTFDVVCYNFSIHYIMDHLDESIEGIKRAVKLGGLLIGIAPEKMRAHIMSDEGKYKDMLGNEFTMNDGRLTVRVSDGPFYGNGPRDEPLLDEGLLTERLEQAGFEKVLWASMLPVRNGLISDLYAKFVYRKSREV